MDYDDRGLAAMPKLVGGPKYSRPPGAGATKTERPPDPDDLPLVSSWTEEDHAIAQELGLDGIATAAGSAGMASTWTATVATAPPTDTVGHAASHPNGSWSISSGSATSASSPKRGFGSIFRGRNGRSGTS